MFPGLLISSRGESEVVEMRKIAWFSGSGWVRGIVCPPRNLRESGARSRKDEGERLEQSGETAPPSCRRAVVSAHGGCRKEAPQTQWLRCKRIVLCSGGWKFKVKVSAQRCSVREQQASISLLAPGSSPAAVSITPGFLASCRTCLLLHVVLL